LLFIYVTSKENSITGKTEKKNNFLSYVIGKRHPGSSGWRFFIGRLDLNQILVIDNYDSFTHNLVQLFMLFDLKILVCRSDKISIQQIDCLKPDYILISPGPKDPANAGISVSIVEAFADRIPILGVCLGMQCINEAMGGQTVKAPIPVHGKTSLVHHNNRSVFQGLPSPFTAARYHSLVVNVCSPELKITAKTDDGIIMGIEHSNLPLFGVQFHPESFMTDHGLALIRNFLKQGPVKNVLNRFAA